jgi:hypothetical protein
MASPLEEMSQIQEIVASIDVETRKKLEALANWPRPYSTRATKYVGQEPRLSQKQYEAFYNSKVRLYNY